MRGGLLARLASLAICVAVLVNAEGSAPEESVVPEVLVQVQAQVKAKATHTPNLPFEEVLDGSRKKDPVFATELEGKATPDPATQEILKDALVQIEAKAEAKRTYDPVFKEHPDLAFSPGPAVEMAGKVNKDPVFEEVMLEEEADADHKQQNPDKVFGTDEDPAMAAEGGHAKVKDPAFIKGVRHPASMTEVGSMKKGAKKAPKKAAPKKKMKMPPVPQKKPLKKAAKKAAKKVAKKVVHNMKKVMKKVAKVAKVAKKAAKKAKKAKKAPKKKAAKKKAAKKHKKSFDEELTLVEREANKDFLFGRHADPAMGGILAGKQKRKDVAFDEELVQVKNENDLNVDQGENALFRDEDDPAFHDILKGNKKNSQDVAFARKSTRWKDESLLQQPMELVQQERDFLFDNILDGPTHRHPVHDPAFASDVGAGKVKDIAFNEILMVQAGASESKLLGAPFNGNADLAFDGEEKRQGGAGPAAGLEGKNGPDPAFQEIMTLQEKADSTHHHHHHHHKHDKNANPDGVFGDNVDPAFDKDVDGHKPRVNDPMFDGSEDSLMQKKKAAKKAKKATAKKGKKTAKKAGKKAIKHATKQAKKHKKEEKKAFKTEKFWARKEKNFRKKARFLNKKLRNEARSMERGVKSAQKAMTKTTAADLVKMRKVAKDQKKRMRKNKKFQAKMKALQAKLKKQDKKAQAKSKKRLAAYAKSIAANKKKIAAATAQLKKNALAVRKANKALVKSQKRLDAKYKKETDRLSSINKKNKKAFMADQHKAQKHFAKMFHSNDAKAVAARAAIVASVKAANKEAAQKVKRIDRRTSKEHAAKRKTDEAYAKKQKADYKALKTARAATAEKFAKKAFKADRAFHRRMQEAGQKRQKALRAANSEKMAKRSAERYNKDSKMKTEAELKSDAEMKECAIDGSECQSPDGSCHKTTSKGPFMDVDLVSCTAKKPVQKEGDGLAWAGVEPPLLPEKCPPVDRRCKTATDLCNQDLGCHKATTMGALKGSKYVGCKEGKASLNAWFNLKANCCDPKNIGFSDNIPMFKMQIENMPSYTTSDKNGNFKKNKGAGSVCGMIKSLVAGVRAGLEEKEEEEGDDKKSLWKTLKKKKVKGKKHHFEVFPLPKASPKKKVVVTKATKGKAKGKKKKKTTIKSIIHAAIKKAKKIKKKLKKKD